MKKGYVRALLTPTFEVSHTELAGDPKKRQLLDTLTLLCAQVLDHALSIGDAYLTVSINRKKDAAVVTLCVAGEKTYATGGTLEELLANVADLL
jgi:transcriptional regulator of NAD metabolism